SCTTVRPAPSNYTQASPSILCLPLFPPSPRLSYALSLHDALPISRCLRARPPPGCDRSCRLAASSPSRGVGPSSTSGRTRPRPRSEEHTSELQSRENLVCRLLLETKKPQGMPRIVLLHQSNPLFPF